MGNHAQNCTSWQSYHDAVLLGHTIFQHKLQERLSERKAEVISDLLPLPSQLSLSIAQITQQLGNSKLGL